MIFYIAFSKSCNFNIFGLAISRNKTPLLYTITDSTEKIYETLYKPKIQKNQSVLKSFFDNFVSHQDCRLSF